MHSEQTTALVGLFGMVAGFVLARVRASDWRAARTWLQQRRRGACAFEESLYHSTSGELMATWRCSRPRGHAGHHNMDVAGYRRDWRA